MKSVLVVDDNQINIMIASHMLESAYEVTTATSGEAALEALAQKRFDLVLLDVLMPGMDGFETLEKIKTHDDWKDIPVIFLTADVEDDTVERAQQSGITDIIEKPFKKDIFLAKVKEVIG